MGELRVKANSPNAVAAARSTGSSASVWPSPAIIASDQRYIFERVSGARPIISLMTRRSSSVMPGSAAGGCSTRVVADGSSAGPRVSQRMPA